MRTRQDTFETFIKLGYKRLPRWNREDSTELQIGPYPTWAFHSKSFDRWIDAAGTAPGRLLEGVATMTPIDNILYFPKKIDVRLCTKNVMSKLKSFYRLSKNDESFATGGMSDRLLAVSRFQSLEHPPFRKGAYRVCVKRDPVQRFISACAHYKHKWEIRTTGFPNVDAAKYFNFPFEPLTMDELEYIITGIEMNAFADELFFPQFFYLGSPHDYDRIYYNDEIPSLLEWLTKKIWHEEDPWHIDNRSEKTKGDKPEILQNSSTTEFNRDELDDLLVSRIMTIYAEDYKRGWM